MDEYRVKMNELKATQRALREAHPGFEVAFKREKVEEKRRERQRKHQEEENEKIAQQLRKLIQLNLNLGCWADQQDGQVTIAKDGDPVRLATPGHIAGPRFVLAVNATTGKVVNVCVSTGDDDSSLTRYDSRFDFAYAGPEHLVNRALLNLFPSVLLKPNHSVVVCGLPDVQVLSNDTTRQVATCIITFRFKHFPNAKE